MMDGRLWVCRHLCQSAFGNWRARIRVRVDGSDTARIRNAKMGLYEGRSEGGTTSLLVNRDEVKDRPHLWHISIQVNE